MKLTTPTILLSTILTTTTATFFTPQPPILAALAQLDQLMRTASQPRNTTAPKNKTEVRETSGPRAQLLVAGLAAEISAQQGQLAAIDAILALQGVELAQQGVNVGNATAVPVVNATKPANSKVNGNATSRYTPPTRFRPNVIRVPFTNTTTTAPKAPSPNSAANSNSTTNPTPNTANSTTIDATPYFLTARNTLLAFVRAAATIRQNNLFLSGINSQVERGLASLEAQQVKQYTLVMRLSGDAVRDSVVLEELRGSVVGGLEGSKALMGAARGMSGGVAGLVGK